MATSSVVIAGATYSDVPSVTLKDTSNTDVSFILTSDADATASDIRKNKIAYANGQKIVGDYELNLQEKTITPSTSTQVVTADTEIATQVGEIPIKYCLSISAGSEKIDSQYYRYGASTYLTVDNATASKTFKALFYIEKWRITPSGEYTWGTAFECEGTGTLYDRLTSTSKTIDFNVTDPDGVVASISIRRESGNYVRVYFTGGTTSSYIKYEAKLYSMDEANYDGLSKVTVNPIPSEYIIPSGTLSVTANGTVDVSAYQYANVNVSGGSQTQSKTATPTKSTQTITPDSGYLLSSVVVNPIPSEYIIPNLQTRTGVTPAKSSQTITPSSGYDGLASVQINAIPSNYIDTTDATASASDIRTGKSAYVNGNKVNGSLVVNKVYVGSTDPASSFGNDGDIYIKVV